MPYDQSHLEVKLIMKKKPNFNKFNITKSTMNQKPQEKVSRSVNLFLSQTELNFEKTLSKMPSKLTTGEYSIQGNKKIILRNDK